MVGKGDRVSEGETQEETRDDYDGDVKNRENRVHGNSHYTTTAMDSIMQNFAGINLSRHIPQVECIIANRFEVDHLSIHVILQTRGDK